MRWDARSTWGGAASSRTRSPPAPRPPRSGKANRRTETKCEVDLRRTLHARGLRFRKDLLIRADGVRTHADVVFTSVRLAVFVDGCFWHVCPDHFHMPKSNLAYWEPKLAANVERDRRVDAALRDDGWTVLRLWEHAPTDEAVATVVRVLAAFGHAPACRLAGLAVSPPP